jgi:hypothetical protein
VVQKLSQIDGVPAAKIDKGDVSEVGLQGVYEHVGGASSAEQAAWGFSTKKSMREEE